MMIGGTGEKGTGEKGADENGEIQADKEEVFDDLTRIAGIGPSNVRKLEEIGVTRFAQIAGWSAKDEEKFGERLAFPGRIEREAWVSQAKKLISDGEA